MKALSPLIFFVVVYLGVSIVCGDFYKVPVTVAFMLTALFAVAISRGRLAHRLEILGRGASTSNIMLMLWIFILAGAFAQSAKAMGSVEEFVNLTLAVTPPSALLAGLFVAAALISLSIGTSVGTIVALTPIAAGIATATSGSTALLTGVVVGGAFFGDNLSFISDTTVVATQTQGCSMSDKFRTNIYIALPAAIVMLVVYAFWGAGFQPAAPAAVGNYVKILPYIVVLITAVCGMNVLLVLTLGILLTGVVGIATGSYDVFGWFGAMGEGIAGMGELIIVSLLAGGILALINANGGIRYLLRHITRRCRTPRSAEVAIATMVALVDVCTANNTIAIITVAGLAREIGQRFGLDPRRVASILDTASCIMQGIIPYGAQLLMAAALAKLNPLDIIPYLYYPYALAIMVLLSILFRFPKPRAH